MPSYNPRQSRSDLFSVPLFIPCSAVSVLQLESSLAVWQVRTSIFINLHDDIERLLQDIFSSHPLSLSVIVSPLLFSSFYCIPGAILLCLCLICLVVVDRNRKKSANPSAAASSNNEATQSQKHAELREESATSAAPAEVEMQETA